ncbi:MAG: hypothetical protein KGK02_10710 [Rhodospirillales bacterium]|nr:hypothetical protein [Rhodospirillales bacterium]
MARIHAALCDSLNFSFAEIFGFEYNALAALQALNFLQHLSPHLIVRHIRTLIRACLGNGGFEQLALGLKIGVWLVNGVAHTGFVVCLGAVGEILGMSALAQPKGKYLVWLRLFTSSKLTK